MALGKFTLKIDTGWHFDLNNGIFVEKILGLVLIFVFKCVKLIVRFKCARALAYLFLRRRIAIWEKVFIDTTKTA